MKKHVLLILSVLIACRMTAQTYVPFPTDPAQWKSVMHWNGSPNPSMHFYHTYTFNLAGDTTIGAFVYQKLYYTAVHHSGSLIGSGYYGALREDSLKRIYFYPAEQYPSYTLGINFPCDSCELLLYDFSNLQIGDTAAWDPQNTNRCIVNGIDSILIGAQYRKVYQMQNLDCFFYWDYWIEGIGSMKNLFSPYSYEFEWIYTGTCYTDTAVSFINTTYYFDYFGQWGICDFFLSAEENKETAAFRVYPVPAEDIIYLAGDVSLQQTIESMRIFDLAGRELDCVQHTNPSDGISVADLPPGVYLLSISAGESKSYVRFIKK